MSIFSIASLVLLLSAVNEDEEHIESNNDHVKRGMNEDTKKSENSADAAGEEHLDRDTVNDDADNVETAREAGERHRGRPVLRTVNEKDNFTKFHNDHFENNTVDGMERNQAQSRRSESSSTETMSDVAEATARMPSEEHSYRNTAKVETDRCQGVGHHARFPHSVSEAGSIVLHVSNSMNEVKKDDEDSEDGEEEGGTTAARDNDEISRKDAEESNSQKESAHYKD